MKQHTTFENYHAATIEHHHSLVAMVSSRHARHLCGVGVGLVDEDQHTDQRHVETESGLLPVPDLGLPHGEKLAADDLSAIIFDEKIEPKKN